MKKKLTVIMGVTGSILVLLGFLFALTFDRSSESIVGALIYAGLGLSLANVPLIMMNILKRRPQKMAVVVTLSPWLLCLVVILVNSDHRP